MRIKIIVGVFLVGLLLVGCQKKAEPTPTPPTAQQPAKVGKPTYVAKDKTAADHVKEYFVAYQEKRYGDAYDLQPAPNKAKQTKAQFEAVRKGFPIASFKILPITESGNTQTVKAEYELEKYGIWESVWTFTKQGKRWVADSYQVSQKQ